MIRTRSWLSFLAAVAFVAPVWAQEAVPAVPDPPPPTEEEIAGEMGEVIVVTASRTEQQLSDAPASISVLTTEDIEQIPADDYGDLLRNVPGVNVTQTSARDVQMTTRGSTNTLATSQLVLLDGRSLYLDFFGFVMWDFLPVNTAEIKQIEAVRGPGSAVWGANAMTGVVNLITKRPREMVGTHLMVGGGELVTTYGSLTHAGASDRFGYKLSGGYYAQDAFDRPTGRIEGALPPNVPPFSPQVYPAPFPNRGTEQPKGDLRFDFDLDESSTLSFGAGYAATDGIIHSGIGPFDIDSGSNLYYGKVDYNRQALHVGFFVNSLDADSENLITRNARGGRLSFAFKTDTYNAEVSNTTVFGMSNILTYGANYRTSDFDLEITNPQQTDRDEWGVFLQDEILFGDKVRWVIGGRYDEIDPLEDGVFTPRTSLMFSPTAQHTFRVSYAEAFRTPSAVNSYLDATIISFVHPVFGPFTARATGNPNLVEEHLTAYELGYVGTYDNGMIATVSLYQNVTEDSIDFFQASTYPGTPIPRTYSYRNLGETTDRGVELSVQQRRAVWNWFFNASWQDDPEFDGLTAFEEATQNRAPEWRANLGLGYDPGPWFVNTNVNYQDEAFWADVLNFTGVTDAFATLNAAVGFRMFEERMTLQVIGSNLTDERIQQHIFGDIISRKITGQVAFSF